MGQRARKERELPESPLPPGVPDPGRLAGVLMRRQARLAMTVAAGFLLLMFGLPLANTLWPEAMQRRVAGFPFSWLLLGVLMYPLTWVLAATFVRRSEALEADDARLARKSGESER